MEYGGMYKRQSPLAGAMKWHLTRCGVCAKVTDESSDEASYHIPHHDSQ